LVHLEIWQWAVAFAGAFLIGISKTGISGIGIFAVSLFALIFPPQESSGIVLPVLICADLVAAPAYRRHVIWSHVWRLFPWAAAGIITGFFVLLGMNNHADKQHVNQQVGQMMGVIFIVIVLFQLWRRRQAAQGNEEDSVPHTLWFAAIIGLTAGFTTMVSNAAGPIMILYLLSMRLPKMEFMGTGAWYFLILNLFKVPFSHRLGLINGGSVPLDLALAPFAVSGALFGRTLIKHIDQKLFENLALGFTVIAAIKLLLKI
jgi:uncharacterized membrane protein YfcA